MDIKELDKKQLILLTLLITFVVSIATGIVTVSLMSQAPKSVPQTINNVIQRTIENVKTIETKVEKSSTSTDSKQNVSILDNGDILVSIYGIDETPTDSNSSDGMQVTTSDVSTTSDSKELGQGVIISDIGLILVDSSILNDNQVYKVVLNKTDFDATIVKKFNNGFSILKITEKKIEVKNPVETKNDSANTSAN